MNCISVVIREMGLQVIVPAIYFYFKRKVLFICFNDAISTYTTGQIINVDGGMNSHAPTVAQFRQMNSRTW